MTETQFTTELAGRWLDFVDCEARLKSEVPFLRGLAWKEHLCVLDAAMGFGCEAILMAEMKHSVVGNEIDPVLRELAVSRARARGVNLTTTAFWWNQLAEGFSDKGFDLILLVGNSFCLSLDRAERIEAAKNFRRLLAHGGKLVIDQRNFDYILANKEEILRGNFRYSGKVLYCGKQVIGEPCEITNTLVKFCYSDKSTKRELGQLSMYPFQKQELVLELKEVGFNNFELFSDLKLGCNPDADFFTWVAS